MILKRISAIILIVLFLISGVLLTSGLTEAISDRGPIPNSETTFPRGVWGVTSESSAVTIRNSYFKIFYPTNAPRTIQLYHADLCSSTGTDYDGLYISGVPSGYTGRDVTYNLRRANINNSTRTETPGSLIRNTHGTVKNAGQACGSRYLNINSGDYVRSPFTGRYVVFVHADRGTYAPNTVNTFEIRAPGGLVSMIGTRTTSGVAQYTGIEPIGRADAWGNIDVEFGSDCTVVSDNTNVRVSLYDPDNNRNQNGGTYDAQPREMRMAIYDVTDGRYLRKNNSNDYAGWSNATNVVNGSFDDNIWFSPLNLSGGTAYITMRADVDHRYEFRMRNVYDNNTLRVGIPFDQIFYNVNCQQREANLIARANANDVREIGQSFQYRLWVDSNGRRFVRNATFNWVLEERAAGTSSWIARNSGTTAIDGSNPRVPFQTPTRTFNALGDHCFRIRITSKPSWANNSPGSATQCVRVNPPPQNSDIEASVSVDNPVLTLDPSATVPLTATFTIFATVTDSNNMPPGSTFNYDITNTGGAPTWSSAGSSGVGDATTTGQKIPAAETSITMTIDSDEISLHGRTYCVDNTLSNPGGFAGITFNNNPARACVYVTLPAGVIINNMTALADVEDHEKGSGDKTPRHGITGSTDPYILCDSGKASGELLDVEVIAIYDGGAENVIGTLQVPNCNSFTADQTLPGNTIDGAAELDILNPGQSYGVSTILRYGGSESTTSNDIIVYEAPFARFFGNDVKVCGVSTSPNFPNVGLDNRFIYKDKDSAGNDTNHNIQGSFSEYASLYKQGNSPDRINYTGLQSSAVDTASWTWDKLLADYGALDCEQTESEIGFSITPSSTDLNLDSESYTTPQTFYVDGNVNITGSGISTNASTLDSSDLNNPVLGKDINNFPIVFIYATGNINISASVNNIEAVLVSEKSINTCSDVFAGATDTEKYERISSNCDSPLKITGAVSAPVINLQRSGGTRYLADTSDPGWKENSAGGNAKASEIIEKPWYLNYVNFKDLSKDSDGKYKAYYGLPPRL